MENTNKNNNGNDNDNSKSNDRKNWQEIVRQYWKNSLSPNVAGKSCINCANSIVLGQKAESTDFIIVECQVSKNKELLEKLANLERQEIEDYGNSLYEKNGDANTEEILARYCPYYKPIYLTCSHCKKKTDVPMQSHDPALFVYGVYGIVSSLLESVS